MENWLKRLSETGVGLMFVSFQQPLHVPFVGYKLQVHRIGCIAAGSVCKYFRKRKTLCGGIFSSVYTYLVNEENRCHTISSIMIYQGRAAAWYIMPTCVYLRVLVHQAAVEE